MLGESFAVKSKLISVFLLIAMLLTSNVICIEDVYAEESTSTGIIAVLAGGNITVAVKDNGLIYVWGEGISGDYAVYDLINDYDSIPSASDLFYKTSERPCYQADDLNVIDGALPSKSVNIGGITLSISPRGRILLNGNSKPGLVSNMERIYGPEKILTNVKEVSEGRAASIAVNNDGSVIAWGDNTYWKVSNARNISSVKAVAAGYDHLVCLKEDGTVVVTGNNFYKQCSVPEGLKNVKSIAAGDYHTIALKEDGTVSVWGLGIYMSNPNIPQPMGLDRVVAIDSGSRHVVALRDDGTIAAWGSNLFNQCNIPEEFKWKQEEPVNTSPSPTPTPISSGTPSPKSTAFKKVFGGGDSLWAITKDGEYTYWGSLSAAEQMTALFPGVKKAKHVSFSFGLGAMLDEEGRVYMSGSSTSNYRVPKDLKNVKQVECGSQFTVALKDDGSVVAWGDNSFGQIKVPQDLGRVKEIACGYNFVLALKEDGTLCAWGSNEYSECEIPSGVKDIKTIAASGRHSLALKNDGTVISFGYNPYSAFDVPQDLTGVKAIACSYNQNAALKEDGTLVVWGYNITDPIVLKNIKHIVGGINFMLAIHEDGSTIKWGEYKQYVETLPDTLIIEDLEDDILFGDLNLDNTVDSIDLALLKMYLLGIEKSLPTKNGVSLADLNGDGQITSVDLAFLRKYVLGMIREFPVSKGM